MKRRICFIINPAAGGQKLLSAKLGKWAERYLKSTFEYDIHYTQYTGHARQLVRKALDEDTFDIIAVAGGDGTINEILPEMIHRDTALLLLPMGSGNGLARHLNYPMSPRKVIKNFARYSEEWIDLGKANGRIFCSIAGLGFDGFIAKSFSTSKRRGFWGYAYRILRHLLIYRPFRYQLKRKSVQLSGNAFLITFFNSNQYGYNMRLANDASIRDGLIDAYVVNDFPRILLPLYLLAILFGWHRYFGNIQRLRSGEYELISEKPVDFQVDGESAGKSRKLDIEIIPLSLKVLSPK